MAKSVVDLDMKKALNLAQKALDDNLPLLEVIEKGFGEGIKRVGDLWDEGEFFLPELMMGGKIVQQCVDKLLPNLQANDAHKMPGKVVMATIEGDIHSIGKSIVATMLSASGFKVYDLGADVPIEKIISTPPPLTSDTEDPQSSLTKAGVIKWTNEQRKNYGLEPLFENPQLDLMSMAKVDDMFLKQGYIYGF